MVVSLDYTVHLERVFQGPMDLLLHLVREQEVDIHEIQITGVIDGYLGYMKDLEDLDIEVAADFIVMAATLMAIKSRSLLPREEVDLEDELDPRDELIQRLIEYRHYKGAATDLSERFEERAQVFRHGFRQKNDEEPTLDFSELSEWDLLSTFSRLMRETLSHHKMHIDTDDRPLRWYVERLVDRIKRPGGFSLRELVQSSVVDGEAHKSMLIGSFCALLELMKLGVVTARQPDRDQDITIEMRDEHAGDIDQIVRNSGFDDETPDDGAASNSLSPADESVSGAPETPPGSPYGAGEDPSEGQSESLLEG